MLETPASLAVPFERLAYCVKPYVNSKLKASMTEYRYMNKLKIRKVSRPMSQDQTDLASVSIVDKNGTTETSHCVSGAV